MKPPPLRPRSIGDARYGAAASRRLLIDTIHALAEFGPSVTVVGAHAVHVWVERAWGAVEMEATRDGDVVLNPVLVAESPKLLELMEGIGTAPALPDRPGVYGYTSESELPFAERVTMDLIVPEAYAGAGRRAARIPGQSGAASRAVGLELALWDRHLMTLATVDDPPRSAEAYVAGPAALLIAKAHKVHERALQVHTRPDRLRPKDSGDIALLMMVASPFDVADTLATNIEDHPEIEQAVSDGAQYLIERYQPEDSIVRFHAADALAARFDEATVHEAVNTWITAFSQSWLGR